MDKSLQELLYMTAKSHANISASSSEFARLRLLQTLISEISELNLDDASRVKIKLWLDKHKNKIKVE